MATTGARGWSLTVVLISLGPITVEANKTPQGAVAKRGDVAEVIGTQPFGPFHVRIIVLCLLIQFLDGFDAAAASALLRAL